MGDVIHSTLMHMNHLPIPIPTYTPKRRKMLKHNYWGEGRKRLHTNPSFFKPTFASERSAWLARLVEQYWHVSIKGLFHTERSCMVRDTLFNFPGMLIFWRCCLFWSARFALQCKNIFFDLFWNVRLFLRLNKGFRSFKLGPSRTRGQFYICSGQIRLEIGQWQKICPESYSRT